MTTIRNRASNAFKKAWYHFDLSVGQALKGCSPRPAPQAIILQYHSIRPDAENGSPLVGPSITITPSDFDRQIAFLKKHFRMVSLDELVDAIETRLPDKEILAAITFDDGYRDNFQYAYPILRKHGLTALFYLTTDCIDRGEPLWTSELRYHVLTCRRDCLGLPSIGQEFSLVDPKRRLDSLRSLKQILVECSSSRREQLMREIATRSGVRNVQLLQDLMLTWDEVRQMARNGMSFGSHTRSHPSLPWVSEAEAREEIAGSKAQLEQELGMPVLHFSYPNPGDYSNYNSRLKDLVAQAGFRSATTSVQGCARSGDDLFELRRKGIYRVFSELHQFYWWIQKESIHERWSPLSVRI